MGMWRYRTDGLPRMVAAAICGWVLTGCEPTGPIEHIQFWAASDLSQSRAFLLPERASTGGGARQLEIVSGNMGIIRYTVDRERRPFLLDGDLESGIFALSLPLHRDYLKLPLPYPGETTRSLWVPELDVPKWTSFRVYDAGACNIMIPWEDVATLLVRRLDKTFADAANADEPLYGAHRVPWDPQNYAFFSARVVPILRARASRGAGPLVVDDDRLQVCAITLRRPAIGLPTATTFGSG